MSDKDQDLQSSSQGHEPSDITYDEQFYPARPARLRPRARLRGRVPVAAAHRADGQAQRRQSGVRGLAGGAVDAVGRNQFAKQFSGQGSMWQNPFANPDPRAAIEKASVWFTAYPISMITKPAHVLPRHARRPAAVAGIR